MNAKVVAITVRLNVVVAVLDPLVPVTVIVNVPTADVGEAEMIAETLHVGAGVHVGGFGVKTTLRPPGRVERLKVTGPATPAVRVAVRVSVADPA